MYVAEGTGYATRRQLGAGEIIGEFYPAAEIDPKEAGVTARLTFPQFFQFCDECLRATREVTVEFPKLLSATVEHDDRGKPENLVLLR